MGGDWDVPRTVHNKLRKERKKKKADFLKPAHPTFMSDEDEGFWFLRCRGKQRWKQVSGQPSKVKTRARPPRPG
ncbi:hypothetical protein C0Q70_09142 [Pomacea canaliculata]|uniref:Uncharacterized protein n=1 Tax=Pomacea canaliculata TaxID=400727 RepID=A0A2T7P8Z2_POMCA|nr:hypothetical protein C0Q70_09142 [Pomacea canaliculata]